MARQAEPARFLTATSPGIVATEHSLFRAASVSKVVTGRTFQMVAERVGLHPPYENDISDVLGWSLRNPAYPTVPITLGQIASHTSSLSDEGGYLIPTNETLKGWFESRSVSAFFKQRPGARFEYSNLGYVVLAAVTEILAGERFDDLARRMVLEPLGLRAGFNWSGVSPEARKMALPTYRRDHDGLHPQIDRRVSPLGVVGSDGEQVDLNDYRPGNNPAAFSPQGGLRICLADALLLAQSLGDDTQKPLWTASTDVQGAGMFESYGVGIQFLDHPDFYPRPLVGHFANAYGFTGGIWWDKAAKTAFAYALNGKLVGDESDEFGPEERALLAALAKVIG